jgi:hypothetical protein
MTDDFTIYQDSRLCTISLSTPNKHLIESIVQTLSSSTVCDDYKSITFNADSVRKIKDEQRLNHDTILKMISCLSTQLDFLITKCRKSFLFYDMKNIIVIDENKFVYISDDAVNLIHNSDDVLITKPFAKTNTFLSPEALNINTIPSRIHYKSIYYSLGLLIVFCLTGVTTSDIESLLRDINGTKLHSFIRRCLDEDPTRRYLIFV